MAAQVREGKEEENLEHQQHAYCNILKPYLLENKIKL